MKEVIVKSKKILVRQLRIAIRMFRLNFQSYLKANEFIKSSGVSQSLFKIHLPFRWKTIPHGLAFTIVYFAVVFVTYLLVVASLQNLCIFPFLTSQPVLSPAAPSLHQALFTFLERGALYSFPNSPVICKLRAISQLLHFLHLTKVKS